jgi:bifunctional UDP-N-acetylglucosamine pyrophosphorylase/glucosamine-1-phosphate N-acetyltransferase
VQLAALGAELNRRTIVRHQRAGVTVTGPGHHLDRRRRGDSGPDTVIAPGTSCSGATSIGANCTIGPDTTLTSMGGRRRRHRVPHAR